MKALVLVSVSPGRLEGAASAIKGVKGVREALTVTGRADVAVFVEGSLEEIGGAVARIAGIEGVETTETLLEMVR